MLASRPELELSETLFASKLAPTGPRANYAKRYPPWFRAMPADNRKRLSALRVSQGDGRCLSFPPPDG